MSRNPSHRLGRWLRPFGPALPAPQLSDLVRTSLGMAIALLLLELALIAFDPQGATGLHLVAPFGATALLLFSAPSNPLVQPWSAVVGNGSAALVAIAVTHLVPAGPLVAPLAVALAVVAMLVLRANHPPGGAVALLIALQPDADVWLPVTVGTVALVGLAMVWHRLTGRVYPFRKPPAPDSALSPRARIGLDEADLGQLLIRYRQTTNLGVADLARLIGAAEEMAAGERLGPLTCGEVMTRDLVGVRPETPLERLHDIFAEHGYRVLPVVTAEGRCEGLVFQLSLIRASGGAAIDIATRDLPEVHPDTVLGAIVPLLSHGGYEALPVSDQGGIRGIITRTDLISALTRQSAETGR